MLKLLKSMRGGEGERGRGGEGGDILSNKMKKKYRMGVEREGVGERYEIRCE